MTNPEDIETLLKGVDSIVPPKNLHSRLAANNKFVSDWLLGLSLDEYVGVFMQSQCDTMQKVTQLTELELITVIPLTIDRHLR